MSPADAGPLLVLAAQLRRSREALERLAADAQRSAAEVRREPRGPWRAMLALALDRLYSALEDTMTHVLRTVDHSVPAGDDWHKAVLRQASLEAPGLRPALLRGELLPLADRLLGFRHFLRHAYLIDLDPVQLLARADDAARLAPGAAEDIEAFAQFLTASAGR